MTRPRVDLRVPRRRVRTESIVADKRLLGLVAANDLDALIDASFHVLQGAVPSDFASAFYRSSSRGLLKGRDSRGRQYSSAFMRRYVEIDPAIALARANRGVKILLTRTGLPRPEADVRKLPFFREVMQRQGWRHAVALCFWGDPPADLPVFVISVYRVKGRRDFSETDVARLASIHPFVDSVVNRLHERAEARSLWDSLALTASNGAVGLAILDARFGLVKANAMARRLCAAWTSTGRRTGTGSAIRAWRLPPILEQACAEMRAEWQAQLQMDPDAAVLRRRSGIPHPHLRNVTASVTMMCRNASGLSEPSFVVEFDRSAERGAVALVLDRMTTTERAVALALMDGGSNQDIADRLAKSVQAVKFLLHEIYRKTGVPNRGALVALLRNNNEAR